MGKITNLLPNEAVAQAMFSVLKPYHKEGKKRIRDERRAEREAEREAREERSDEMPLKEACFEVIPAAAEHVSGDGKLSYGARRLFYAVRDMTKALTSNRFHPKTGYDYFRDTILQEYQRAHGKLKGLYYDPRGRLHEPHGGAKVDMGTREVEAYSFPEHVYNKILYVEKKGQFPLLEDAQLMVRYDLAIMTGEGFATEAARTLLANADKNERIQIFVLHDADPSGYNIARTVREATERMPDYSVDVIDLGLTVPQGVRMGLEPEEFDRKSALQEPLVKALENPFTGDPLALEYFTGTERKVMENGKQKTIWVACKRFELDKMTAPEAVALIERGLNAEGVFGKVVPPPDELPELAEDIYRSAAAGWADSTLKQLLGWEAIKEELADEFLEAFKLGNSERYIRARFKKNDTLSWKTALRNVLTDIHQAKHTDALRAVLREKVTEALKEEEEA